MPITPAFQTIRANGVNLRCVVEGDGPLVLMIHGWPESWYSWRHQIGPVRDAGYRVVVPDVRGYGGSDAPHAVEAYDMESLIGDVLGLIEFPAKACDITKIDSRVIDVRMAASLGISPRG